MEKAAVIVPCNQHAGAGADAHLSRHGKVHARREVECPGGAAQNWRAGVDEAEVRRVRLSSEYHPAPARKRGRIWPIAEVGKPAVRQCVGRKRGHAWLARARWDSKSSASLSG